VIDKRALAVDLDHGQPLAVRCFQCRVAGDVDLPEFKLELARQRHERLARALAQMAPGRVVESDLRRYGYKPLVVVASATRPTAIP
jgi:hypothetical protein